MSRPRRHAGREHGQTLDQTRRRAIEQLLRTTGVVRIAPPVGE